MFANRKYEELSYPKNKKMCDLILVTPWQSLQFMKMWAYIQQHIPISLL